MDRRRWTALTYLAPNRDVDRDDWWRTFALVEWPRTTYGWTSDSWNGFRDFGRDPRECVEAG
ncbi:MAG: hypothetical protein ABEH78_04765 [Haloferacaceae archaeon]